jgi:hypothetical protein
LLLLLHLMQHWFGLLVPLKLLVLMWLLLKTNLCWCPLVILIMLQLLSRQHLRWQTLLLLRHLM